MSQSLQKPIFATSADLNADGMQIETDQNLHPFTSVDVICGGCVHASVAAIPGEIRWKREKGHIVRLGIAFRQEIDWSSIIGAFIRKADSAYQDALCDQKSPSADKGLALETRNVLRAMILDEILEDLVNPLTAVIGRLDLLSYRLARSPISADTRDMSVWSQEIDRVQNTLFRITELCKASDRRKSFDVFQENESFFLRDLINKEIQSLNLRPPFKRIHQTLNLSPRMSPVKGNYAEWANAFIILCHIIQKQTAAMERPKLVISASESDSQTLIFAHNGTAINSLEEHPCFIIFKLLQKRHGVVMSLSGRSGNQQIILAIPRTSLIRDTHLTP